MTSCAEWTGVLLSTLLKECGVKGTAKWFVAEGAEEVKGASSMPIAKAMDDCILAYGMNGEAVRPQNGFPLRLMVPGFEGIFHTKWMRRIKLVDRYYMNYNDFGHLDQEHQEAALGLPDRTEVGDHVPLRQPAAARPRLLRDQRAGVVRRRRHPQGGGVDRRRQELEGGGVQRHAATHGVHPVRLPWNWDGTETVIMSRCMDELGSVQPSRAQIAKHFNKPFDQSFSVPGLNNTISRGTSPATGA